MLEPGLVAEEFLRHVATSPAGFVACSVGVAFEAWFQVELAHMPHTKGVGSVRFGYDYPHTRCKADLACESEEGISVFELKCFVRGADANKLQTWPEQLCRLLKLIQKGDAAQGWAVSTYFGYEEGKMVDLISKFHPLPWRVFGPRKFFEDAPLQMVIGSVTLAKVSARDEIQ
jgi:hypothetical protein